MKSGEKLVNFLRSRADMETFHGLPIDESSFIEIALKAWERIGNRNTIVYVWEDIPVEDGLIEIPCGLYRLHSVTVNSHTCGDTMITNSVNSYGIDGSRRPLSVKAGKNYHLEPKGEYIAYTLSDTYIKVDPGISKVNITYTALITDDDGLPYLTEKEAFALSWYVAYILKHREMLSGLLKDPSIIPYLKNESDRLMRDARVSSFLSQNVIDSVLNIKTSHERKRYNRSFWLYKDI